MTEISTKDTFNPDEKNSVLQVLSSPEEWSADVVKTAQLRAAELVETAIQREENKAEKLTFHNGDTVLEIDIDWEARAYNSKFWPDKKEYEAKVAV